MTDKYQIEIVREWTDEIGRDWQIREDKDSWIGIYYQYEDSDEWILHSSWSINSRD